MKCCVASCGITGTNYPPTFLPSQERVTFYEFPGHDLLWLRNNWLSMVGISECRLPQGAVVCSQHFRPDDFFVYKTGTVQLRGNSVPSVFKESHCNTSTFKFCVICLDTGASRLYVLNNNRLAYAFTNVTGLSVRVLRDRINTVPKLCPECAQRLSNCDTFKDKAMRANTELFQLLRKHTIITAEGLKSVNRRAEQLTSNLVKHTFTPDHCDLHLVHNEENNNIQQMDDIMCNSEENIDVKSEKSDETIYESDKDATDCEIEYLSELDDIYNKDVNEIQEFDAQLNGNIDENIIKPDNDRINDDNIRKACKTNNVDQNISKLKLNDNSNIINPDSIAADIKGDEMLNCDVDSEVEFLDKYRDRHNDSDIYHDDDNDIDEDIAHDDDINDDRDFDFDVNDDINELLDDDAKNIYKALLGGNTSENKVSLNNVIFVKDPRPIIQHKDSIPSIDTTNLYNHLNKVNPSSSFISLNASTAGHSGHMPNKQTIRKNLTQTNQPAMLNNDDILEHNEEIDNPYENNIVMNERKGYVVLNSDDIPTSVLKDIQDGKIVMQIETESNKDRNKSRKEVQLNSTKIDAVNERLGVLGKRIRFWDQDLPRKHDPRPRTQDCVQEDLKSFTMTWLSHEEQMAEVQKRKDTEEYQRADLKCETCYKPFWQPFAYQRHLDRHTTKFGQFSCEICGIHTKTKRHLRNHIATLHSHRYNCKQCDFATIRKSAAVNHQRWHSGYKYACEICGVEYECKSSCFSHMRLKHPSDYACALCGYSFVSPKGVLFHMNLRHPFEDTQNLSGPLCEECDIRFASDAAYQQHLQVTPKHAAVGKRKRNEPEVARYGLPKRRKPHKPVDCVLCDLCGRRFQSAAKVRDHMHVHTGVKAHKCDICHKRFSQQYNHKTHMLVHHSDNPPKYTCGVCHKEFSNVKTRKKHMASHQESRKLYKCDQCEKLFTTACGRNLHVSHVHHNVPRPKRHRPDRYKAKTRTDRGENSDSQSQDIGANETITAVESLSEALEYEEFESSS